MSQKDTKTQKKTPVGSSGIHKDLDPLPSVDAMMIASPNKPQQLLPSKRVLRCYHCGQFNNPNLKRCNSCLCTYFCNVACQKASWATHKQECVGIRDYQKDEQSRHQAMLQIAEELLQKAATNTSFVCSVCLEEASLQHTTVALPCGHSFCYGCIKEVGHSQMHKANEHHAGVCPQCRAPMPHIGPLVGHRTMALLYYAEHISATDPTKSNCSPSDGQKEDDEKATAVAAAYEEALKLVTFVLNHEPSDMVPRKVQGDIYLSMHQYDKAVVSYKQAYSIHRGMSEDATKHPNGLATQQAFEERMQYYRDFLQQEPRSDVDLGDTEALEADMTIMKVVDTDLTFVSQLLLDVALAMVRSRDNKDRDTNRDDLDLDENDVDDKRQALQLVLLVQRVNHPAAKKCGGCRPIDQRITQVLVECLIALQEFDHATTLIAKGISKFRYVPKWHHWLVDMECQRRGQIQEQENGNPSNGNISNSSNHHADKALYYAIKAYFYEQAWNEEGTRATNLTLAQQMYKNCKMGDNRDDGGVEA